MRTLFTNLRHGLLGALWAVGAAVAMRGDGNWALTGFVTASMLVLPGLVLLDAFRVRPVEPVVRLTLGVVLSLGIVAGVGGIASWVGPQVGVARPLDRAPQLMIWAVVFGVVAVLSLLRGCVVYQPSPQPSRGRWIWVVLALPLVAAAGALRVSFGHDNDLAVGARIVGIAILVLAGVLAWCQDRERPYGVVLYSYVLAGAWAVGLRGEHVFGWDIQKEWGVGVATMREGIWQVPKPPDAYQAMLSLTVVPAQLHAVAGLSGLGFLRVVAPMLLALVAPVVYAVARRFSTRGTAFGASAVVVIGSRAFVTQLPAVVRQELAFVAVVALLAVVTDSAMRLWAQRALVVILGMVIAVTHYTTGYITAVLVVMAWGFVVVGRMAPERRGRRSPITFVVVLCFVGVILGWNLGVTRSGVVFDHPIAAASTQGAQVLPVRDRGLIQGWLLGTGVVKVPYREYEPLLRSHLQTEAAWITPDDRATLMPMRDSVAERLTGVAPRYGSAWNAGSAAGFQAVLVFEVVSTLVALWWWIRRRGRIPSEVVGLVVAVTLIAAALRVSSTAAAFYNPERGAAMSGLFLAVPVAIALDGLRRRSRVMLPVGVVGVLAVVVLSVSGLPAFVVGGAKSAAFFNHGEDVERFRVSPPELATVRWLDANLTPEQVVQTDRYGQLAVSTVKVGPGHFATVGFQSPVAVDRDAFIYASRANVVNGRARSLLDGRFVTYEFPKEFFDVTRAVVYATEYTQVYR